MTRVYTALLVTLLVAVCCFSNPNSGEWSIKTRYTASSKSRFYVLNDWRSTFAESTTAPFPAMQTSDIMLKTMGIMKAGISWDGVQMKNMFSRPLATALFVMDGISSAHTFSDLSGISFPVDQTGLSGCSCNDARQLFQEENVATYMSNLFDGTSQTNSVSANAQVATTSAGNGGHTTEEQVSQLVDDIKNNKLSLSKYGLDDAAAKFDVTNEVDAKFFAELVLIKQTMEQLKELKAYVSDSTPDVFIFTLSTVEGMENKYASSAKMAVVMDLVKKVMQESTKTLVSLYDGKVLVQALVLQWNKPAVDKTASELQEVYNFIQPYLVEEDQDSFFNSLPEISLKEGYKQDSYICWNIKTILSKGNKYYAVCPLSKAWQTTSSDNDGLLRKRRSSDGGDESFGLEVDANLTFGNLTANISVPYQVENRTGLFSAMFLIVLFITLSLGLAIFAASWALWTMDPGDSIIFREVSDPTGRM